MNPGLFLNIMMKCKFIELPSQYHSSLLSSKTDKLYIKRELSASKPYGSHHIAHGWSAHLSPNKSIGKCKSNSNEVI